MGKTKRRYPRREFIGLTLTATLAPFSLNMTQTQIATSSSAGTSPVTMYDLDRAWPRKSETLGTWAGNPAIMVDAKQQVWVSNRAFPAMMTFDTQGNFIRAWDSPKLFSEKGPALFQNREKGRIVRTSRIFRAGSRLRGGVQLLILHVSCQLAGTHESLCGIDAEYSHTFPAGYLQAGFEGSRQSAMALIKLPSSPLSSQNMTPLSPLA